MRIQIKEETIPLNRIPLDSLREKATPQETIKVESLRAKVLPFIIDGEMLLNFESVQEIWTIPHLLPIGLTIFAGDPKMGKSRLMRSIALDLALGQKVLGDFEPLEAGAIVYFPLEESVGAIKRQAELMLINRKVMMRQCSNQTFIL